MVEAIVALPIVLPPTVLGYYILVGLGPRHFAGRVWQSWFGHTLPFTFGGLLVASVLYSLPFAVQPFSAGFEAVDRQLIEASWTLGASRLATFFRVILPLSAAGAVTGIVLSFAHTIGEFGVVLMVGGNIPGVTRTVSIDIYDQVQAGKLRCGKSHGHGSVAVFFFGAGADLRNESPGNRAVAAVVSSTGFSLWGSGLAMTKSHRLKPVLRKTNHVTRSRD